MVKIGNLCPLFVTATFFWWVWLGTASSNRFVGLGDWSHIGHRTESTDHDCFKSQTSVKTWLPLFILFQFKPYILLIERLWEKYHFIRAYLQLSQIFFMRYYNEISQWSQYLLWYEALLWGGVFIYTLSDHDTSH